MSRQVLDGAYLADLRARVRAAGGARYEELFRRDLCVAMTFLLAPSRSKTLDVDNMAKVMWMGYAARCTATTRRSSTLTS